MSSETSTSIDKSDLKRISSDSEDDLLVGFNETSARRALLDQNNIQIGLNREQQKDLGVEIGKNVSGEKQWKEIAKQKVQDNFTYAHRTEIPEIKMLYELLSELDDKERMLVGYMGAATLSTDENEPFSFSTDAKATGQLVRQLEANDRRRLKRILYKYPRSWHDGDSEQAVDLLVEKSRSHATEIEIQRLRPIRQRTKCFTFRMAEDARDGYVELVPRKHGHDFDVLERRKIDVAVQAALQCVDKDQQTDPTFPANAWTQYCYELFRERKSNLSRVGIECKWIERKHLNFAADDGSDDEEAAEKSVSLCDTAKESESAEPPMEISPAIKELLIALEFNSIDMYN